MASITASDRQFFEQMADSGRVLDTASVGRYGGEYSGAVVRRWSGGSDSLPHGCHLDAVDRPREATAWVVRHDQ